MSRIRTIKPDFWRHEELSELSEATHMLAAALLNYADDDGYFNANPKLIQAECCPLREPSVSIPVSIQELSRIGYLRMGSGPAGKRYGQIVSFSEHQVVSHKKESKIKGLEIVWDASSNLPVIVHPEWNGIEGEGKKERKHLTVLKKESAAADASLAADAAPLREAVRLYNETAEQVGLPQCQSLTKARRGQLQQRLSECGGIEGWKIALAKARDSPLCRGDNDRGWKADFDFLVQAKSFTRLMEGAYDRKQGANGKYTIRDSIEKALEFRRQEHEVGGGDCDDEDAQSAPRLSHGVA
jgi:hypothetical protein